MLEKAGKDYHHKHVQKIWADEGLTVYKTLKEASEANSGEDCYVLSSTIDDIWFVCCGTYPTEAYGDNETDLKKWYKGVSVKGRISKATYEAG